MIIIQKNKIKNNLYHKTDNLETNKQKILVTSNFWIEKKKELLKKKFNLGIELNSDDSINIIEKDLNSFSLIQFNFISLKDGRPFTYARKLRELYKFKKEIRASGNVIPDQYIFLLRCGFDSVEIEDKKKEIWLKLLKMDKGLYYQP